MAGWWWAARPPARGAPPPSPLAASLLRIGEPRLEYPRGHVPAELSGEPRTTWRSAHLDGWKWRLAQCLDGQPAGGPPGFFPPDDHARAAGFSAGWTAADAQVAELERSLGTEGAQRFVRARARAEPRLHDPRRSVPPPAE
jgi:hypothetical protein